MEKDWKQWIQDWEESGQTQRRFCLEQRLDYHRFKVWRKQGISQGICQSKHPAMGRRMSFSELTVSQSKPVAEITIELPHGITLRIRSDVSCA